MKGILRKAIITGKFYYYAPFLVTNNNNPRDRVGIPLPTNINPYEEIGEIPDCILSSHIVQIHKYDIPGHLISSSSLSASQNYYSSVDGVI